ncbi:hypothetical protein GCM10007276_22850 [Agaricicola taiwanensis]|uniref:Uncharacterized protein n=1 Tax=Agaricicola taiwanensis TaxID=591372 RepID=A0A8J3DVK1_9RHOB|nr:hypothetical protein [Agaricicola taiwanensis]GGE45114.1 hypothetical protein GCM10007276_22850 [Agaricicola taiwanensis]
MGIWTLDISGTAVVVIGDVERDEAQDIVSDDAFQDDLMAFESDGAPLWDGTAELVVREAMPDEHEIWKEARAEAEAEEDFEEDEASVVFLVPVSDPDDEED